MSLRDELIEVAAVTASRKSQGCCNLDRPTAAAVLDAILARLGEPENEMLRAGYEAMFVSEWDGTQAPMMGAGWDAMLATLEPKT